MPTNQGLTPSSLPLASAAQSMAKGHPKRRGYFPNTTDSSPCLWHRHVPVPHESCECQQAGLKQPQETNSLFHRFPSTAPPPVLVRAQVYCSPAAMALILVKVGALPRPFTLTGIVLGFISPVPNCPSLLPPQHSTSSVLVMAQV